MIAGPVVNGVLLKLLVVASGFVDFSAGLVVMALLVL